MTIGELMYVIGADSSALVVGLESAERSVKAFGRATQTTLGAAMGVLTGQIGVFQGLTRAVASWYEAIQTAFGGMLRVSYMAARRTNEIRDAFIDLQKVTGQTNRQIAAYRRAMLDLAAANRGLDPTNLAKISVIGAKLGVPTEQLAKYAFGVSRLAVALDDLPAEVIAEQVAKISKNFNLAHDQVEKVGSVIDKLADSSTSNASELLFVLNDVSQSAGALGLTVPNVSAMANAILDMGQSAAVTGSSLNVLFRMMREEDGLKRMAQMAGYASRSLKDVNKYYNLIVDDPMEALNQFFRGIDRLGYERDRRGNFRERKDAGLIRQRALDAMGISVGDAARALAGLAKKSGSGGDLERYLGMANEQMKTGAHVAQSFAVNAQKASAATAQFHASVDKLAVGFGDAFAAPVYIGIMERITKLVGDLATKLEDPAVQAALDRFADSVLGAVDTIAANLDELFRNGLAGAKALADGILGYFGTSVDELIEKVAWLADRLPGAMQYIADSIKTAFTVVTGVIKNLFNNWTEIFGALGDMMKSTVLDAVDWIVNGVAKAMLWMRAFMQAEIKKWADLIGVEAAEPDWDAAKHLPEPGQRFKKAQERMKQAIAGDVDFGGFDRDWKKFQEAKPAQPLQEKQEKAAEDKKAAENKAVLQDLFNQLMPFRLGTVAVEQSKLRAGAIAQEKDEAKKAVLRERSIIELQKIQRAENRLNEFVAKRLKMEPKDVSKDFLEQNGLRDAYEKAAMHLARLPAGYIQGHSARRHAETIADLDERNRVKNRRAEFSEVLLGEVALERNLPSEKAAAEWLKATGQEANFSRKLDALNRKDRDKVSLDKFAEKFGRQLVFEGRKVEGRFIPGGERKVPEQVRMLMEPRAVQVIHGARQQWERLQGAGQDKSIQALTNIQKHTENSAQKLADIAQAAQRGPVVIGGS